MNVKGVKKEYNHRVKRRKSNKTPTGGLEPPTTRLRAWHSTD